MLTERDIRRTDLYGEIQVYFRSINAPGDDKIVDASDITVSPDGSRAAFTGILHQDLSLGPVTRVCIVALRSGAVSRVAAQSGSDRMPRWSPDGTWLAFLSDREQAGHFRLLLCRADGTAPVRSAPPVDGVIEALHWSPDAQHVLLVVAGFGADAAGCHGGATVYRGQNAVELPAWAPVVDTGDAENLWRRLYLYHVGTDRIRLVDTLGINCWEAAWLGNKQVAVVSSTSHSEGSWYRSVIRCISLDGAPPRVLYQPSDQIGVPAASPSGRNLALLEAVCSDRLIVAGNLLLIDTDQGAVRRVDTGSVDVTHVAWRNERRLIFVGHRGLETVVGEFDSESGLVTEQWASLERTCGAWYPSTWPLPDEGCVVIGEGYDIAPEIAVIKHGHYEVVTSLDVRSGHNNKPQIKIAPVYWRARDGLEMQGWVIRPQIEGPLPLVMDIHGGPVWACRNRWQGRLRGAHVLAQHGVASFYPNPRGSSGRGLEFARLVVGDMGGDDTYDYLTGIDALVEQGIADPRRLGVTGISYGGFMSAWLITQDPRFVAAAPISCVADWYSQHRTSQIPHFDELFLRASAREPNGKFFERSPVMHVHKTRTPTLQLTGALDQNTPPTQALEFHRSLLEQGVPSILLTYPTAGHGIRGYPEVIDATTRYVGWFLQHLER